MILQHGPKPYKFIWFGEICGPKRLKFIGLGDIHGRSRFCSAALNNEWLGWGPDPNRSEALSKQERPMGPPGAYFSSGAGFC